MNKPNHSERGHAEFSPSSLKYVAACAAYEGREGTSEAAEKGTRIHEALEVRDPSALHDEEEVGIYDEIVKMEAEFMSNFGEVVEELNEIQVDIDLFGVETYGTCDRFLILEGEKSAVMADYKTGISIIDPPEKNWQAKAYVVGAFQRYPKLEQITFAFYVPLHEATLTHTFTRKDDMVRLIVELHDVIRDGERVRPLWKNGQPDLDQCSPTQYCRFCKHEDKCPALGYMAVNIVRRVEPTFEDIDPYAYDDPAHLSQLFNAAKIVEAWSKTVKSKASAYLKKGENLAGLRLRSMGKTRKCTSNTTLLKIAEQFGVAEETLLEMGSFPLAAIAKKVASGEKKERKSEKEKNFLAACEDAGIVQTSSERFSVVSDDKPNNE